MKLNEAEREMCRDMIENGQWDLVLRVVAIAVEDAKTRLLNLPLEEGKEKTFQRKAKFEGAKEVKTVFEQLKTELKRNKK